MTRWVTGLTIVMLAMTAFVAVAQDADDETGWRYDDGLIYEPAGGNFGLTVNGWAQMRITAKDPELGEASESFDIPRAKVRFVVDAFDDWELVVQTNLAEGSENEGNLLEDAFVRYKKHPLAQFWFGQGKVHFGRQALTESSRLQFIDRSIASREFFATAERNDNRDVGMALQGENHAKTYAYSIGVYNGNGINKDEKDNSDYMVSARLVTMPFGEFPMGEVSFDRERRPRLAVGISALSVTRGTAALQEKIRDTTASLEFAFSSGGLNLNGEFFTRSGDEPLGQPGNEVDSDGWYFQGGYLFQGGLEVALRYAEILRDIDNLNETEEGVAINYYLREHGLKLQLDYRSLDFEAPPSSPDINRDEYRFQMQFAF